MESSVEGVRTRLYVWSFDPGSYKPRTCGLLVVAPRKLPILLSNSARFQFIFIYILMVYDVFISLHIHTCICMYMYQVLQTLQPQHDLVYTILQYQHPRMYTH